MSESDKPFVCTSTGCGQRFTNHDHLITHQQKHDLSLRFRQGESLLIDQTPTPTRFLRNCEESGLFEELEEANPFDQDFKTVGDGSSSKTQSKANANTKPTEYDGKFATSSQEETESRVVLTTIPMAPPANLINPDKPVAMATVPAHISTASALTKQKLLQAIQMKEQQKFLELTIAQQLGQSPEFLAQALKNMLPAGSDHMSGSLTDDDDDDDEGVSPFMTPTEIPARRKRGRKPDEEEPEIKRQRFLERNRAAASRCRAKKKVWVDNLENRCKDVEMINQSLSQEVVVLRSEVQQLKSILIAHKDCPLIVHQNQSTGHCVSDLTNEKPMGGGVTLLSQLASMPSMSPLITSPVPSVGSVVPNIQNNTSSINNGFMQLQQTPEVAKDAKDVEISAEAQTTEQ